MPHSGGNGAAEEGAAKTDADLANGRHETFDERMDRNWEELLQEIRVTQTGNQILTAFLFAVAFQPRFTALNRFQVGVYLILIMVAALTTALGLAPVTLHRRLFRRHAKEAIVHAAHIIVQMVLIGVGLVLTGVVLLIFDVVVGRAAAYIAASATVLVLLAIAAFPILLRPARGARAATEQTRTKNPRPDEGAQ